MAIEADERGISRGLRDGRQYLLPHPETGRYRSGIVLAPGPPSGLDHTAPDHLSSQLGPFRSAPGRLKYEMSQSSAVSVSIASERSGNSISVSAGISANDFINPMVKAGYTVRLVSD